MTKNATVWTPNLGIGDVSNADDGSFLLMEDGYNLLLEDDSNVYLEGTVVTGKSTGEWDG